jgi:hypothetical protein
MYLRYLGRSDKFTDGNGVYDAMKADRDVLGKATPTQNGDDYCSAQYQNCCLQYV